MQMSGNDRIIDAWKADRPHLLDLAFRMLGDIGTSEDMVQEAFLRLSQTQVDDIDDPRGWLIVVTSRLCLDYLRSAHSRRERPDELVDGEYRGRSASIDPADRVTLDDEVRLALLVVLERLTPAERVAFVLHDVFQLPFDMIAATVGKPSPTCRQLAHRARLKISESKTVQFNQVESLEHQTVSRRFIAACATGDLDELLAVLDPNVSGEVDTRRGIVVGADRVGRNILRFWGGAGTVLVSQRVGAQPALLAFVERKLAGILALDIDHARITKVHVLVDPATLEPVRAQLSG
jgi:RNA polymerase sigma-70 factor (ECF subfamily)